MISLKNIKKNQPNNESVTINSQQNDALALRCELIDQAKDTLLISQYSIEDDDSGLIFIGKLLNAAQRGVKVKLLVNGLSNNMTLLSKIPLTVFQSEPNIELKMIGGINFFKLWEINNILHDKLIIVDNNYFLSSGRNIGKRFMIQSEKYKNVEDMDIIVKKEGGIRDILWVN